MSVVQALDELLLNNPSSQNKQENLEIAISHHPALILRQTRFNHLIPSPHGTHFLEAKANALQQLYSIGHRFTDPSFSLLHGLSKAWEAITEIFDIIIGKPDFQPLHTPEAVAAILKSEKQNFLLRDLNEVRPNIFVTLSSNQQIDFRLFDFLFRQDVFDILRELKEIHESEWLKNVATVRIDLMAKVDVFDTEDFSAKVLQQKNKFLIQRITKSEKLKRIDPDLGLLIASHLHLTQIFQSLQSQREKRELHAFTQFKKLTKQNYPVRSLIHDWTNQKIADQMKEFYKENSLEKFASDLIDEVEKAGMKQEKYLVGKLVDFHPIQEKYRKQLSGQKGPKNSIGFKFSIWDSRNWIIVPEIDDSQGTQILRVKYEVQKYSTSTISSDHFGWRLSALFYRSFSLINNCCHYLLYEIFFSGPFGLRALFYKNQFHPKKRVNARTGGLEVDTSIAVQTLASEITSIWTGAANSVKQFEASSSTSMGGPFLSFMNKIWNYGIKAALGTALYVVGFPPIALCSQFLSLGLATSSFIIAPSYAITVYAFDSLIFDTASYKPLRLLSSTLKFSISGVLQMAASLFAATVVHPSLLIVSLIFAYSRYYTWRMVKTIKS